MERDWDYLKEKYGLTGARSKFEDSCLLILQNTYKKTHTVRVSRGDGGIDVYSGDLNGESLVVFQCKFFLENLNSSRISQIQESLIQAITTNKYKLKKWYVCLPKTLSLDEIQLFDEMKERVCSSCDFDIDNIDYFAGDTLIGFAKQYNVYDVIFDIRESIQLNEIHQHTVPNNKSVDIDLTNFSLPSLTKINNFLKKYENSLSGNELKYISFLFQELLLNAEKHGFANDVQIIKKHNSFIFIDDGKKFNPLIELSKKTGGGTFTVNHIESDMEELSLEYKYEEEKNKLIITFENNRNLINEDCIVVLQGVELFYPETRDALLNEIIKKSQDNECESFIIDVIESEMAISHKVQIVNKIIHDTTCNIIFKIRNHDNFFKKFINEFAKERDIVDRIKIEVV